MAPSAYDDVDGEHPDGPVGKPRRAAERARRTTPIRTCHATATRPGSSSTPMVETTACAAERPRRTRTATDRTATLVAKGSQNRRAGSAGTCSQNSASRIGSTSDTVAIEARSSAPSSADGCDGRRRPTMMAKPSVTTCARRKANRPSGGRPGIRGTARSTRRRDGVESAAAARLRDPRGCARPSGRGRAASRFALDGLPVGPDDAVVGFQPGAGRDRVGRDARTTIAPPANRHGTRAEALGSESQVIRSARYPAYATATAAIVQRSAAGVPWAVCAVAAARLVTGEVQHLTTFTAGNHLISVGCAPPGT